jgi:hypothetical protein
MPNRLFLWTLPFVCLSLQLCRSAHAATFRHEAEDADFFDCILADKKGTSFVDFVGKKAWIEWKINIGTPGDHKVSVRYSSKNTRSLSLVIDGIEEDTYSFPETLEWNVWATKILNSVSLTKGEHTVRLQARGGAPNVDWMSIQRTNAPIAEAIVLKPGENLSTGEFVFSPSGEYSLGLRDSGFLILKKGPRVIWESDAGGGGGAKCHMQPGGNLVLRDNFNTAKWTTHTSDNPGARLVVDDGGRVAVKLGETPLFLDGLPRNEYSGPSSNDLEFPIRGTFYYPWFPQTWTVAGKPAHHVPSDPLGFYSSDNPAVVEVHIDALEYAHINLSVASWWGPGTNNDRSRLSLLMEETIDLGSQLKWSVYHEDEQREDASPVRIREDLDYLKKWFAWHEAWAHIDGRPVIFVYNEAGCEVVRRWTEASNGEWYVVLKVFKDFKNCRVQPNSWHQYGPAHADLWIKDYSFSVSPGFWRADKDQPDLPRVSDSEWRHHVQSMVDSNEPWQLITTFNEAGEGTMVESSIDWPSISGYGIYLDALNEIR